MSLIHKLVGYLGAGYLHVVSKTSFIYMWDHPGYLERFRNQKSFILGFWHNSQVYLAYAHRHLDISVLVSRSKDGEYIAQVLKQMGLKTVRGSSSRGGEQALKNLCEVLKQGGRAAFTPDGPRGPLQTVHGGIVMAAQYSGAPIIPITNVTRRKIVFNSWDKFVLPLPFSTTVVAHGQPLYLPPEMPLEEAQQKVREALNRNVAVAEQVLRDAPSWGTSLAGAFLSLIYTVGLMVAMPFSIPVFILTQGPERTFRFLSERFGPPEPGTAGKKRLWMHAASIGEWQALKPVLRKLKEKPDVEFIVTVNTPEARVLAAQEEPQIPIRMLPLDLPWILSRWVKKAGLAASIVVETEIWPNMVQNLARRSIPLFLVNARLSQGASERWAFVKPFIQRSLLLFSAVFARTDLDGGRYYRLGAWSKRIQVLGNTKYDNLTLSDETQRPAKRQQMFGDATGIWVIAGSTWNGEEASLLKLFEKKRETRLRLILAPRHKDRFAVVAKMLESIPASWSAWSKVKGTHQWDTDILLVDTLGDLKNLYQVADIAFVGGSLTYRGGQNPIEPAASGIPVLFGPSMENFHEEAAALKKLGAARQARHEKDLLADIEEIAVNENERSNMGTAARRFVEEKQGAAARNASALSELLNL